MNLTGPNDDESDLFKVHEGKSKCLVYLIRFKEGFLSEIDPGNETAGSLDIKVHDDGKNFLKLKIRCVGLVLRTFFQKWKLIT